MDIVGVERTWGRLPHIFRFDGFFGDVSNLLARYIIRGNIAFPPNAIKGFTKRY